jgi:hypothetical protein
MHKTQWALNYSTIVLVANSNPHHSTTATTRLTIGLSDEEVLLACRAFGYTPFLQKRNRIDCMGMWTLSEERKQQQKLAKGSQSGRLFWEDPLELT